MSTSQIKATSPGEQAGEKFLIPNTAAAEFPPRSISIGLTSIEERLRHLDSVGVDRQVISWSTTWSK